LLQQSPCFSFHPPFFIVSIYNLKIFIIMVFCRGWLSCFVQV
jgi:hypothetical protein